MGSKSNTLNFAKIFPSVHSGNRGHNNEIIVYTQATILSRVRNFGFFADSVLPRFRVLYIFENS